MAEKLFTIFYLAFNFVLYLLNIFHVIDTRNNWAIHICNSFIFIVIIFLNVRRLYHKKRI